MMKMLLQSSLEFLDFADEGILIFFQIRILSLGRGDDDNPCTCYPFPFFAVEMVDLRNAAGEGLLGIALHLLNSTVQVLWYHLCLLASRSSECS